jgi:hypothetical protein
VRMPSFRWTACTVCAVVSCFVGIPRTTAFAQQGPSIRQQLQETGGFQRIIVTPYEPLPLADLTARAKLVVEATISATQSYVDDSGVDVYTDYTLTVHAVIKSRERSEVRAGDAITVRRRSGVIVVDGRTAEVYENDFPPFKPGEHYILFLTRSPREYVYAVFGGNQGAFSAGEIITPLATPTDQASAPRSVSQADFLGEVRALLKFSEH